MDISRISVSREDVWQTCKAKYKFQYHLKVPSPEEEPFYFVYGKIIHKIAEEYVRNKGKILIGEIANSVLNGEIALEEYKEKITYAPKEIPPKYKKRIPGMLRSLERFSEQVGFDGEIEWDFEYDLDPPNKKMVTGFIDRLIEKNGTYFVIDYKTTQKGRYRKTPETILTDLQLRCYSRVVQKKLDIPASKIKAALYYLEGGNLVPVQFSEKSLIKAEMRLLKAYNDIEAADPDNAWGRVGPHCTRCNYRSICPFYRNANHKPKLPDTLS